jgi:phosphoribosylamine--glycine ligase
MTKVLLLGKEGRLDCIAEALRCGKPPVQLYTLSELNNPGLLERSVELRKGQTDDPKVVVEYARKIRPDFAVIGPEEPLATGVVDALTGQLGIPCVGPTRSLARLESSKSFTRELLSKYGIPGNPEYRIFRSLDGLKSYIGGKRAFVVKPDGLTGGKGVKIFPEHLQSLEEVLQYCSCLFQSRPHHPRSLLKRNLKGRSSPFNHFATASTLWTPPSFKIISARMSETLVPTPVEWDRTRAPTTAYLSSLRTMYRRQKPSTRPLLKRSVKRPLIGIGGSCTGALLRRGTAYG